METLDAPVGRLERAPDGALSFTYSPGVPPEGRISLSMPVREEAYRDAVSTAFFANLLFEGRELDRVKAVYGIDRNDIAKLLYHLGADCPGAISVTPEGTGPGKRPGVFPDDYEEITDERMTRIIAALHFNGKLPDVERNPSPLAGVQPKIALVVQDGRYFQPKPGSRSPTTHILKVSPRDDTSLTRHEAALLALARDIGLDVIESEYLEFHDEETRADIGAILSRRFDRVQDGREIRRLHSEDFCQALGLPRELKYERDAAPGGARFSAKRIGDLAAEVAVPAQFQMEFLRHTLFNLAVGNTDNHGKNASILYRGRNGELAPLYDVVPVIMAARPTHRFSFGLGSAEFAEDLDIENLTALMRDLGFRRPKFSGEWVRILTEIAAKTNSLAEIGDKSLADATAAQLNVLQRALEIDLEIPARDFFPRNERDVEMRPGGWGGLS
jgi:serine/threonine-protein kinase HipA